MPDRNRTNRSNRNSFSILLRLKTSDSLMPYGKTKKAVDPSSGNGGNGWDLNSVTNPYAGWQYDVGPSQLDRTHVAFVNFVYDIPLLRTVPTATVPTASSSQRWVDGSCPASS